MTIYILLLFCLHDIGYLYHSLSISFPYLRNLCPNPNPNPNPNPSFFTFFFLSSLSGKLLLNIQSKYDFAPKDGSGPFSGTPTTACDNVCRCLLEVANTVRSNQVRGEKGRGEEGGERRED
jgi:hypothetical protein